MARPKKETSENEYRQFFDSHVKEDDSGCYLWQAAKNNIGYGLFRYHGKMQTSHRVQLKLLGHDIDKKIVFHSCDNYDCVNPAHLQIGTLYDKAQVVKNKGRSGRACTDSSLFRTCIYCGYVGNPLVIGHVHNEKCKHKPK